MMSSKDGVGAMEEALIILGLIFVQALSAAFTVLVAGFLANGLDALFLVSASSLATSFLLLPLAITLEKKKWPKEVGVYLIIRLALIALGGIAVFQVFTLLGVKKTSPAIATAMPNLAPGIIFIIASCLRLEKFNIKCKYTRAKIVGTVVCLSGAMGLSFLQTPQVIPRANISGTSMNNTYNEWMIGCLYLFASVFGLSCAMVLQALTMVDFPAPLSLCVLTSLMGSIITGLAQIITQGNLNIGSSSISITNSVIAVIAGGFVASVSSSIMTCCVHRRGPVFVSIFNPMQTICATILSAIILKQFLSLGGLAGMVIMFAGLYIVLWAKKKEVGSLLAGEEKLLIPENEKSLLC